MWNGSDYFALLLIGFSIFLWISVVLLVGGKGTAIIAKYQRANKRISVCFSRQKSDRGGSLANREKERWRECVFLAMTTKVCTLFCRFSRNFSKAFWARILSGFSGLSRPLNRHFRSHVSCQQCEWCQCEREKCRMELGRSFFFFFYFSLLKPALSFAEWTHAVSTLSLGMKRNAPRIISLL